MVVPLPPGTILQLMYLRERLKKLSPGRFVEIGPGEGDITHLLLQLGWKGVLYDIEGETVDHLKKRFLTEIEDRRVVLHLEDYLNSNEKNVDLVISSMVMEHLDDAAEHAFMVKTAVILGNNGRMIGLVPASPDHWGIEDEIAGHFRRYTIDSLRGLISDTGWGLLHVTGLTFPISNLLLPVSDKTVYRNEKDRRMLSVLERTKKSGRRKVQFKTQFPPFFGLILNRIVFYPFHLLQKACGLNSRSLVIYFEASPSVSIGSNHGE